MKKFTPVILTVITMVAVATSTLAATRYTYVTPKAPYISPSLKPCIAKYRAGNYTGAMIDLEELLKKERTNTYAKYYLALCYTKLGYDTDARAVYNEIIKKNRDDSLVFYSKRALACIDDPKSEGCKPLQTPSENTSVSEGETDMEKFIYSGKKVHPAAMDMITKERMEVKLQQDEYNRRQRGLDVSYNATPTNEEIAAALNTLSKVGINPFQTGGYMLSNGLNNEYMPMYSAANPDLAQMMLFSQLNQQKNNFINYGI